MRKSSLRFLLAPALLAAVTCSDTGIGGFDARCTPGIDTDADGVFDSQECELGTDPTKSDSDGDGISDGEEQRIGTDPLKTDSDGDGIPDAVELSYPKVCVAQDRNTQRRPPPSCMAASDCMTGETCNGLDPTKMDSDGDGVSDNDEDKDGNGTIASTTGETDPRLFDTNGDGLSDKESGARICRPDGLAMITQVGIQANGAQVGHDPIFGMSKTVSGTKGSAVLLDDTTTGVSGLAGGRATTLADLSADRIDIEGQITAALTGAGAQVANVFIGRRFVTHELNDATSSTFRVVQAGVNASTLRDRAATALTGTTAASGASVGADAAYYLDVTVVRRSSFNDIIVAISPTTKYDDLSTQTAIRVNDLTNTSAVAQGGKQIDFKCQGLITNKLAIADILWTVDISASMGGNQTLIANTAQTFFRRLRDAGVDFRVGVLAAGSTTWNLSMTTQNGWPNGFEFIQGSNLTGDYLLCRQVTAPSSNPKGFCPQDMNVTNDPLGPFGSTAGNDKNEEPAAQAVLINDLFKKNAAMGVPNPNFTWRPGVSKIVFMANDEFTNDYTRYFRDNNNPDTGLPFGATYSAATLSNIVTYFKDNQIQTYGMVPLNNVTTPRACSANNAADVTRCIIEGNGGAWVDVNNATDQQVQAAMNKLVDAIAGAASQYKLTYTPITSTIKVTIRGIEVPRSRQNGFDYDPVNKTVVFYGSQFRPELGDEVYISYRVWKGSLG